MDIIVRWVQYVDIIVRWVQYVDIIVRWVNLNITLKPLSVGNH